MKRAQIAPVVAQDERSAPPDTATPPRGGRSLTITLALPPRELCGNGPAPASRGGKIARSNLIKDTRAAAYWEGVHALERASWERLPYFAEGRVRVDVTVYRNPLWSARRLDDDNFIKGTKAQMDGLTEAGVWKDDRQVQWGEIRWVSERPGYGRVEVTLTEVEV